MNQRRHAKAFPLAATLVVVALAICFVTFAVKALTVKYQVVQGGSKMKQLERELAALALSNQTFETTKERLTSPSELKKKLESGHFKDYMAIKDTSVIVVGRPATIARATLPTRTPSATPTPNASRPPKSTVAAANVIIGREDRR